MPPFETRSSQFGLVSGIRQPSSDMVLVAEPAGLFAPEARKGQLYLVAEADQERGRDACQLVSRTIRKVFYEDSSYSVTAALRKAISAANKALYEYNFSVASQKRAVVGVTCAVIKGGDLYIAQILPGQVYVLAGGKLRAIPSNPSWNPTETSTAAFLKPGALGASLSVEPEFYRAVLQVGAALLLCSSNLSRLLNQEDVLRLLRTNNPTLLTDGLVAICKANDLPEAHGIAAAIMPPLSPAAEAAPLSRAGISERGMMALRGLGGWASRVTGEAALLVRGPGVRTQRQKAGLRQELEQYEQSRMSEMPADSPPYNPNPIKPTRPLDLGTPLEQRVGQERRERSTLLGQPPLRTPDGEPPPSAYMGEGSYAQPPINRAIDLSDTPGMAAMGRGMRGTGAESPPLEPTIGERLAQPFTRISSAFTRLGHRRRLRRPPPSAMPQRRRQQGLSYRRQRPPFPWQLLLLLVALVALAVLYGLNLSRASVQRQTNTSLEKADQAIGQLRNADDASAQSRLEAASVALAEVRSTGAVTATLENRQRYDELEREYERALASIQKQTYFDDLTEIARHPTPGGIFASVVVPPPPQGITNTAAFESIYMLDSNAGILYRMPRTGGALTPLLKPDDTVGPLVVGKIKAQAWREDNIVAVSQNGDSGPFTFYFRNGGNWGYTALAGSETWIRAGAHFHAVNYGGNLYVWNAGAAPDIADQVQKYISGSYGEFPDPWIKDAGNQSTTNAVDLAVDGNVYLLKPDGHILVFEAGKFKREITPQGINPPITLAASFFVTSDPDSGSIFVVDFNQRVLQLDKQTGALIQQVRPRPDSTFHLDQLTSLYVDASGARPVLYLVNGDQVLRGSLPDQPRPFRPSGSPAPSGTTTPDATTAVPAPDSTTAVPAPTSAP